MKLRTLGVEITLSASGETLSKDKGGVGTPGTLKKPNGIPTGSWCKSIFINQSWIE